jgi:hypothetical protein
LVALLLAAAISTSAAQDIVARIGPTTPTPNPAAPAAVAPKASQAPHILVGPPAPSAIGPAAIAPGGDSLASTGTPTCAPCIPSSPGTDLTFTALDKTQFSALWWGPAAALATTPVGTAAGLAFDGIIDSAGETMTFAGSQPDLALGKEYWIGSAATTAPCQPGPPCNPCTVACPTRLVITVTDVTGATPIPLVLASTVPGIPAGAGAVAPISANFKVNLLMQMQVTGSTTWSDPKTWYDALPFLQVDKDLKMVSTFDGGFWHLPTAFSAVKNQQYTLAGNDGATWVEMDPNNEVVVAPGFDQIASVGGNVDLWTANAGFNQDVGIFASDNGGADQLVAWKESGGFAGTFSPNAAFVQGVLPVTAGHVYTFKLKWKTNKADPGTIFAGAGPLPPPNPAQVSPTRLTAKLVPGPANAYAYDAVTNTQYHLVGSDGANWIPIDSTNLKLTIAPTAASVALLGANADLWTANAGFNQDIAIFVSDNGGADALVGWKESGGFAGTFSPNAAYLQSTFAMTASHTYVFTLKWKTNKNGAGATIYAGAGPLPPPNPAQVSPTRLSALVLPPPSVPMTAVTNTQYTLPNSNGATWTAMDASSLKLDITPTVDTNAIVSANVDLWTATAGFNQDVAVFVTVDTGTPTLVAWKEAGGFAGTFSPNAAFLQATYAMTATHVYHFVLEWKTNKAGTSTIFAGAGPLPPPSPAQVSPTRLTVLPTAS